MEFDYEGREARAFWLSTENAWAWSGSDLCSILDISTNALQRIDKDYNRKTVAVDSLGRRSEIVVLLEPGVWELILRSNSDKAKPVQKWLYEVVLPQIRRTGGFTVERTTRPRIEAQYSPEAIKAINSFGTIAGIVYNKIYDAQGINDLLRVGLIRKSRQGTSGGYYYYEKDTGRHVKGLWQRATDLELEQNKVLQGKIIAAREILGAGTKEYQNYLNTLNVRAITE